MLIIFDWDGTVVDSLGKIQRCMQAAMRDAGLPVLDESDIRQIVGLGMHEATDTLFPEASAEQKGALQVAYREHFIAAEQAGSCSFYPGVLDTIQWLRDDGHLTAIATGKSRAGLDRVLAANGKAHLFDGSRCADETASKPDPMMIKQLLQQFQVPADDAIMIGDTDFDLNMAAAAGVDGIGVSFGAHSIERLKNAQSERIFDSYAELQAWLKGYSSSDRKNSVS